MQISVTGHHVEVTDALKSYVDSKFQRLERHFDQVINVHVVLSVEKLRQKAEASILINGAKVFADEIHEDMYAAIDGLIDKLDRQVLKHKEKKSDYRNGSVRKGAVEEG
jgi:putative sigma-54 modulation protein